jgi:hypothetical protein
VTLGEENQTAMKSYQDMTEKYSQKEKSQEWPIWKDLSTFWYCIQLVDRPADMFTDQLAQNLSFKKG